MSARELGLHRDDLGDGLRYGGVVPAHLTTNSVVYVGAWVATH